MKLTMKQQVKITLLELKYEISVLERNKVDITTSDYFDMVDNNYFVSTLLDKHNIQLSLLNWNDLQEKHCDSQLLELVDEAMQTEVSEMNEPDTAFYQAVKSIDYFMRHIYPDFDGGLDKAS